MIPSKGDWGVIKQCTKLFVTSDLNLGLTKYLQT